MITKADIEARIRYYEQALEVAKTNFHKHEGFLEEAKTMLIVIEQKEKKLLTDAAEAEKKAADEASAKKLLEEGSAPSEGPRVSLDHLVNESVEAEAPKEAPAPYKAIPGELPRHRHNSRGNLFCVVYPFVVTASRKRCSASPSRSKCMILKGWNRHRAMTFKTPIPAYK